MSRPSRIYRLTVVYPEGSHEPGWRPACWNDPQFLATLTAKQRREHKRTSFRWPRERRFLSSSGAYWRAGLLRWYGAEVEVLASDPVTWPNYDDSSTFSARGWEHNGTAASWCPELDEADEGDMPLPSAEFARLYGEYLKKESLSR